jgi:hypothetical protein
LTIQNFTLDHFYFHGLTFGAGATNPTVDSIIMRDMGQQFLKVSAFPSAINGGIVRNSTFEYSDGRPTTDHDGAGYFYGGMIDVHNSSGWTIEDNFFVEVTPTQAEIDALPNGATRWDWSPAVYFWNRSTNPMVRRNTFINCARAVALGLIQRGGGENDCYGGTVENNVCVLTTGRLSAEQQAGADAPILLWDCPGGRAVHNTVVTHGQSEAIQGRWAAGLEISNNACSSVIHMRDNAAYSGAGNILSLDDAWFVNIATGDAHLTTLGRSNISTAARLSTTLTDFDGTARPAMARPGAFE